MDRDFKNFLTENREKVDPAMEDFELHSKAFDEKMKKFFRTFSFSTKSTVIDWHCVLSTIGYDFRPISQSFRMLA